MPSLYISEYEHLALAPGGAVIVGQEPSVAEQKLAIGSITAQSSGFNERAHFVRIHCDVICSIAFGDNPSASSSTKRLAANQTEYFGVTAGQKVAVITNI